MQHYLMQHLPCSAFYDRPLFWCFTIFWIWKRDGGQITTLTHQNKICQLAEVGWKCVQEELVFQKQRSMDAAMEKSLLFPWNHVALEEKQKHKQETSLGNTKTIYIYIYIYLWITFTATVSTFYDTNLGSMWLKL